MRNENADTATAFLQSIVGIPATVLLVTKENKHVRGQLDTTLASFTPMDASFENLYDMWYPPSASDPRPSVSMSDDLLEALYVG
jgi:hypothetical protein